MYVHKLSMDKDGFIKSVFVTDVVHYTWRGRQHRPFDVIEVMPSGVFDGENYKNFPIVCDRVSIGAPQSKCYVRGFTVPICKVQRLDTLYDIVEKDPSILAYAFNKGGRLVQALYKPSQYVRVIEVWIVEDISQGMYYDNYLQSHKKPVFYATKEAAEAVKFRFRSNMDINVQKFYICPDVLGVPCRNFKNLQL